MSKAETPTKAPSEAHQLKADGSADVAEASDAAAADTDNSKQSCTTAAKVDEKSRKKNDIKNKKQKVSKKKDAATSAASPKSKHPQADNRPEGATPRKPRALVEELKLFQNNSLLNQQDPMLKLHQQLNEIIRDDARIPSAINKQNGFGDKANHESLLSPNDKQQFIFSSDHMSTRTAASDDISSENLSTVKKGVLWQQQQHEKFHQRLFSRWKKRYFILTTDYLVCFKRSSSKVGRSEMGRFLYKISLSEIKNVLWSKPKKSDKGAIILHTKGQFSLLLWANDSLDEWMLLVNESIERHRARKSVQTSNNLSSIRTETQEKLSCNRITCEDLYENTNGPIPAKQCNTNTVVGATNNTPVDSELKATPAQETKSTNAGNPPPANGRRDQASTLSDKSSNQSSPEQKRGPMDSDPAESQAVEEPSRVPPAIAQRSPLKDSSVSEGGEPPSPLHSGGSSIKRDMANSIEREHNQGGNIDEDSAKSHLVQSGVKDRDPVMIYPRESDDAHVLSPGSLQRPNRSADNTTSVMDDHSLVKRDEDKCDELSPEEGCDTLEQAHRRKQSQQLPPAPPAPATNRPRANLIRRDDSWQSLVSLTRIGKGPQANPSMQAASGLVQSRPVHGRQIMPDSGSTRDDPLGRQQRHKIHIESTVTPIRGPLLRHHSVNQKNSRPLAPIGQHAASFDVPSRQADLPGALQANQRSPSYQHKLLQLQLLHNSNNVDYIRHYGTGNDYQICGPESTANPYGYYSMRSNLKSAASEFSFIRPSSSSSTNNNSNNNAAQSTLPHNHNSQMLVYNQNTRQQQPMRSSMILPNEKHLPNGQQQYRDLNNNCLLLQHGDNGPQFLINPLHGERLISHHQSQQQQQQLGSGQLISSPDEVALFMQPPTRELPLKPNKKRAPVDAAMMAGGHLPKSSSLTSNIICFFRRAFSRRSKKRNAKRRSNLAESCSSSLGAFNDNFMVVPVIPSAFSTGGKSIDNGGDSHLERQAQRLADMPQDGPLIQRDGTGHLMRQQDFQQQIRQSYNIADFSAQRSRDGAGKRTRTPAVHQFGSPLHKSNSISTAIGIADKGNRMTFLHDNEQLIAQGHRSPMMSRSAKVMSANLTPVMSQRDPLGESQNQYFMSPRLNKNDPLPRPSSIYGQPSMISSPVVMRDDKTNNNFGLHRASMHSQSQFTRDWNLIASQNIDNRRPHMLRVPFLDTTREVAEEASSPVVDGSTGFNYEGVDMRPDIGGLRDQLVSNREGTFTRSRQAVVNPTLQSTTMDTIYDNHPMLTSNTSQELASYSHYDNHIPQLQQSQIESRTEPNQGSNYQASVNFMRYQLLSQEYPPSPAGSFNEHPRGVHPQFYTPVHQRSFNHEQQRNTLLDMRSLHSKPAAIVAPTSQPDQEFGYVRRSFDSPMLDRRRGGHPVQQGSPILTRRAAETPCYQQSPLVSNHTRVINKGDGVQATIAVANSSRNGAGLQNNHAQPVINIAGAPGIKLDPSLAASLLRGTNINAFESTASEPAHPGPSKSQTFLVSTRLSKTMVAHAQSPPNSSSPSTSSTKNSSEDDTAESNRSNSSSRSSEGDQISRDNDKPKAATRNLNGKGRKSNRHRGVQPSSNDISSRSGSTKNGRKASKSSNSDRSTSSAGSESLVSMEQ